MKGIFFLAAALASTAFAEDTTSPLTFTYATFLNGTVKETSTTFSAASASTSSSSKHATTAASSRYSYPYGDEWDNSHTGYEWDNSRTVYEWDNSHTGWYEPSATSTKHATSSKATTTVHPTSYTINPSDLTYPTFPTYPASISNGPVASGLPNSTQFGLEAVSLILLAKNATTANCNQCRAIMAGLQVAMRVQQELLSEIAYPFCKVLSAIIPFPVCIGLLNIGSTDIGGIIPAMDITGDDGGLLCAFMFGVCPLPSPPPIDADSLFKGKAKKPARKKLIPSKKEPLKVLHFSDYHLDPRHVVGAEAACGVGLVCCRVFPYTNTSAAIKQPSALFGNYLCDTPEALATSVFRGIPKATGYEVEDFSFGIYTGDLVTHDIWELTEPYVLANELASYQQFFDGMGSVPIYPTLGNHDTYPHAFTSWPSDTGLPANASYPIQQLWNYRNVSAAWVNYGWLSATDAQSIVSSGLGIYRTLTDEGLVIISINSDAWYYFNLYNYISANVADKSGMFSVLVDYLLEAEENEQPVWIIQHVNPGGSTSFEGLPAQTDLFYAIVDRFNATIRETFYGHTHRDEFGVFYANNATSKTAENAAAVAWIAQSVTPYQQLNAGFRYYLVDADTFQVLDSVNYYANISNSDAWLAQGDVQWEFEYSARQTYDYNHTLAANEPLSPAFWHNVAEDIATNATTYQRYTDLSRKLYRPYSPVNGTARSVLLCGLTSMSVPIFEACLGIHNTITSFL